MIVNSEDIFCGLNMSKSAEELGSELLQAAEQGDILRVQNLIQHGADPNYRVSKPNTTNRSIERVHKNIYPLILILSVPIYDLLLPLFKPSLELRNIFRTITYAVQEELD